jgi:hypothetical protein
MYHRGFHDPRKLQLERAASTQIQGYPRICRRRPSSRRAAPPKFRGEMLDFEPAPNTPDHKHWLKARMKRRIEVLLAVCTVALVTGMMMTFYSILTRA